MRKIIIKSAIVLVCATVTLPLLYKWYWWNLALMVKIGQTVEQCE